MPKLFTKNGRDFYTVTSLLQKSLRRGDATMCARAINELLPRYANYCWNRLMTVSAEDCADMVTTEIVALYDAWEKVNQGKGDKSKGRIFFAKAVIILARAHHSRDADELNLLVADRIPDDIFDAAVAECEHTMTLDVTEFEIPAYVYDVHTQRGKALGMTKQRFLVDEHHALTNATSTFGNFDEMVESRGYVQPEFTFDQ